MKCPLIQAGVHVLVHNKMEPPEEQQDFLNSLGMGMNRTPPVLFGARTDDVLSNKQWCGTLLPEEELTRENIMEQMERLREEILEVKERSSRLDSIVLGLLGAIDDFLLAEEEEAPSS